MDGFLGQEESKSGECHSHILVVDGWMMVFSDKIQNREGVDIRADCPEEWGCSFNKHGG